MEVGDRIKVIKGYCVDSHYVNKFGIIIEIQNNPLDENRPFLNIKFDDKYKDELNKHHGITLWFPINCVNKKGGTRTDPKKLGS